MTRIYQQQNYVKSRNSFEEIFFNQKGINFLTFSMRVENKLSNNPQGLKLSFLLKNKSLELNILLFKKTIQLIFFYYNKNFTKKTL